MTKPVENRRLSSALFAGCDGPAPGALTPLGDPGLSAPKNLSIIDTDDHQLSWLPGLTTIAHGEADQGAFATKLLIERLHRRALPTHVPAACRTPNRWSV